MNLSQRLKISVIGSINITISMFCLVVCQPSSILYWTRYNVFMKRKTEKFFFSLISKTQVFASGFTLKSFNSNTLSPLFKNKEYSILSQINSLIWPILNLVFRHLLIRLMALKCKYYYKI